MQEKRTDQAGGGAGRPNVLALVRWAEVHLRSGDREQPRLSALWAGARRGAIGGDTLRSRGECSDRQKTGSGRGCPLQAPPQVHHKQCPVAYTRPRRRPARAPSRG